METSFKPVNIAEDKNPSNVNGDISNPYKIRDEDSGRGFFQTLLVIVTVIMFLSATAVFAWRISLNSSIDNKKQELEADQQKIASIQFADFKKVPTKFHIAKILVENHPFVSDIFKILEHSVQSGIVYNKFDTHTDVASGNYYVEISGTAPGYRTLIQQIDIFKIDPIYKKYFLSTEVGNFKPNSKGEIDFSLKIKSNINGVDPVNVMSDLSKSKIDSMVDIGTSTTTKQNGNPVISDQQKIKTPVIPQEIPQAPKETPSMLGI